MFKKEYHKIKAKVVERQGNMVYQYSRKSYKINE